MKLRIRFELEQEDFRHHLPGAFSDSDAGVSILELERESGAQHLQNALASDPSVEFV